MQYKLRFIVVVIPAVVTSDNCDKIYHEVVTLTARYVRVCVCACVCVCVCVCVYCKSRTL
jgi:hypothetical protein